MGAYRGDLTEGFLHYDSGRLIFGGAYTWRGLFLEFYGIRHFIQCWSVILGSFPILIEIQYYYYCKYFYF